MENRASLTPPPPNGIFHYFFFFEPFPKNVCSNQLKPELRENISKNVVFDGLNKI